MLQGKISKLVKFMENNQDHVMCYHDLEVFDSKTNSKICNYTDIAKPPNTSVEVMLKPGTFVVGPAMIVKSHAIPCGGFNANLNVLSDWILMIEIATKGKVGYIDKVLSRYRRHHNNISNKKDHYNEYFICIGILRSKYPHFISAFTKFEGTVFAGFMVNYFRANKLDLAFLYANEAFIRGYKPLFLLPLWLIGNIRFSVLKKPINFVVLKIFNWIDNWYKQKSINYKIYQQTK